MIGLILLLNTHQLRKALPLHIQAGNARFQQAGALLTTSDALSSIFGKPGASARVVCHHRDRSFQMHPLAKAYEKQRRINHNGRQLHHQTRRKK